MPQALEMDTIAPTSSTTLCLACSASLPPRRAHSSASASSELDNDIFFTPCCNRPICPSCLASNPRLRRYNPCLHCLGGVGVVRSRINPNLLRPLLDTHNPAPPQNIDGGVHDADVYVVGDEDEDEDDGDVPIRNPESATRAEGLTNSPPESGTGMSTPPPPYTAQSPSETVFPQTVHDSTKLGDWNSDAPIQKTPKVAAPVKYYIKPGDTLVGISLKYGIDGYLLCRVNGLPPSTMRTTPHLLHTRTFLTLPPTPEVLSASTSKADDEPSDAAYEARRAREKAEKRLQTLTKEVDWRVAKAYVAFAEHGEDEDEEWLDAKQSEKKVVVRDPFTGAESNLEARAIDRYMDDDVWEAQEREAGRGVSIPRFPLFESKSVGTTSAPKSWWKIR